MKISKRIATLAMLASVCGSVHAQQVGRYEGTFLDGNGTVWFDVIQASPTTLLMGTFGFSRNLTCDRSGPGRATSWGFYAGTRIEVDHGYGNILSNLLHAEYDLTFVETGGTVAQGVLSAHTAEFTKAKMTSLTQRCSTSGAVFSAHYVGPEAVTTPAAQQGAEGQQRAYPLN